MEVALHPVRRRRAIVTAACALLLVEGLMAAGCGSTLPLSHRRITVGFSAWPGWFPWQVAQQEGFFVANGLDVELKYYDNYTDSLKALADGAIDANSQTLNDTLASISAGSKQTIVLVNDNSTGNDKIIARDGISSIADLKGKSVAVEAGTVDHHLLLLALQQSGLSPRDIQLVPMPTDAAATAFAQGRVDAVGAFAPFTTTALLRPGSRAIGTSAEFPGAIPDLLVVTRDMAQDRAGDVQALVDTWFQTLHWIRDHHSDAVTIMAKRAGVTDAEYATYDAGTTIFTLRQNLDAFTPGTTAAHLNFQADQIADFLISSGLVALRPSLDGLLDSRFIAAAPQE
jgi:NitT/TauT family transport system substrate-binding protein